MKIILIYFITSCALRFYVQIENLQDPGKGLPGLHLMAIKKPGKGFQGTQFSKMCIQQLILEVNQDPRRLMLQNPLSVDWKTTGNF